MKLKNTTEFFEYFLRRMTGWCADQVGVPRSAIKKAEFGKRSHGSYNGRAWSGTMRFRAVIGPESEFPTQGHVYRGRTSDAFRALPLTDRIEALVAITAHEVTHLREYHEHRQRQRKRNDLLRFVGGPQKIVKRRGGERRTMFHERRVLELFRSQRDALLSEWNVPPKDKPIPTVSIVDRRADAASKALVAWQRKFKLAQTKIRKYRQRVQYYERRQAARGNNS